jgi:hypothetical protein
MTLMFRIGDLRALCDIKLPANVEHHNDELHSSKQQGDIALALKAYVTRVSVVLEECCKLFHTDVAKVDRDVAYVAMVVHERCKLLFSMFHLFFLTYVASVFIWFSRI